MQCTQHCHTARVSHPTARDCFQHDHMCMQLPRSAAREAPPHNDATRVWLAQTRNGLYIGDASLVDELKHLTSGEWSALQQAYGISKQKHLHAFDNDDRVTLVGHTTCLPLDPPLLVKAATAGLDDHVPAPKVLVHMTTNVSSEANLARAIKRAMNTEAIAIDAKRVKTAHEHLSTHNVTHPVQTPTLDLDANGVPSNTFHVTAKKQSFSTINPLKRKRHGNMDIQCDVVQKRTDKTPPQFGPGVAAGRSTLIHPLPTISHLHHPTTALASSAVTSLMHSTGNGLMPSWQPEMVTRIHESLFPFGRGGPDEERPTAIGMHACVAHTLRLHTQTFPSNSQWMLERHSTLQRKLGQSQLRFSVRAGHNIITKVPLDDFKAAATHQDNVSKCLKRGTAMPEPPANVTKAAMEVISSLKHCRSHMKGSCEHAQHVRAMAHALLETFGSLSLWSTTTPDDTTMPNFIEHCKLNGAVVIESADFCKIAGDITKAVNANAGATAFQYDQVIKLMITHFFGWENGEPTRKGGIFGHLLACMIVTEEQQRLTLHGHAMLWVKNFPSSTRAFINSLKDSKFVKGLIKHVDRMQKCSHGVDLDAIINDHDHNHLGSGKCRGRAQHVDAQGQPTTPPPDCNCSLQCEHARGCNCAASVTQVMHVSVTMCTANCPCKQRNKPCTHVCGCTPACCGNQPQNFHDYLMPPSSTANAIKIDNVPNSHHHVAKPIRGIQPPQRVQCIDCGHMTSAEELLIDWALTACTEEAKAAYMSGDEVLANVVVDVAALLDDASPGHHAAMANLTLARLAVQCHDPGHRRSCFKNKKKESKPTCRFHYPRTPVKHTTLLVNGSPHDEDNECFNGGCLLAEVKITDIAAVEMTVKRAKGSEHLNSHNDMHLAILKSNSDLQVCLGNPGVAHYITTCACKHVLMLILAPSMVVSIIIVVVALRAHALRLTICHVSCVAHTQIARGGRPCSEDGGSFATSD